MNHQATAALPSTDSIAHPLDPAPYPPAGYAWYVVGVLTLAYVLSFIDRQILSLMVEPIRRDLGISDKQMSLLMGASFAVFYTFFGIPLGRLADTRSRRGIIAVGIAFWSVMTTGCGLVNKFWQLALLRMGLGVGEASLSPSAYSLIFDYFRPAQRSTAISVYSMGIYIGSGLAFILGGLVIRSTSGQEHFILPLLGAMRSWQIVFFVVGLPGFLMSLLLLTIREPERQGANRAKDGSTTVSPVSIRRGVVLHPRQPGNLPLPELRPRPWWPCSATARRRGFRPCSSDGMVGRRSDGPGVRLDRRRLRHSRHRDRRLPGRLAAPPRLRRRQLAGRVGRSDWGPTVGRALRAGSDGALGGRALWCRSCFS